MRRLGLKHLPLLPSQSTMEMMVKAATAVYEGVVEEHWHRRWNRRQLEDSS
jgi:hypothetical protein